MNTIRLNTIGDSPVVVKKGSQVQSQEKTVEITENGTTEVVPDAGFSLSKVTISTNVAGGGAGNESTMEYLDVSGVTMESFMQDNLLNAGYFANIEVEQMGRIRAVPTMYSQGITPQKVYSVAIDLNHGYVAQGQELTGRNAMINGGWTNEQIDSLPRLTADEFYKWALEA